MNVFFKEEDFIKYIEENKNQNLYNIIKKFKDQVKITDEMLEANKEIILKHILKHKDISININSKDIGKSLIENACDDYIQYSLMNIHEKVWRNKLKELVSGLKDKEIVDSIQKVDNKDTLEKAYSSFNSYFISEVIDKGIEKSKRAKSNLKFNGNIKISIDKEHKYTQDEVDIIIENIAFLIKNIKKYDVKSNSSDIKLKPIIIRNKIFGDEEFFIESLCEPSNIDIFVNGKFPEFVSRFMKTKKDELLLSNIELMEDLMKEHDIKFSSYNTITVREILETYRNALKSHYSSICSSNIKKIVFNLYASKINKENLGVEESELNEFYKNNTLFTFDKDLLKIKTNRIINGSLNETLNNFKNINLDLLEYVEMDEVLTGNFSVNNLDMDILIYLLGKYKDTKVKDY